MERLGLEVRPEYVVYLNMLREEAEKSLESYIKNQSELPTAFLACNDVMAIAAIGIFQRFGYRVPQDISVIRIRQFRDLRYDRPGPDDDPCGSGTDGRAGRRAAADDAGTGPAGDIESDSGDKVDPQRDCRTGRECKMKQWNADD